MLISTCSTTLSLGTRLENEVLIAKCHSKARVSLCRYAQNFVRFEEFWGGEFLHHSYQKLRRAYVNYIEIIVKAIADADNNISAARRPTPTMNTFTER